MNRRILGERLKTLILTSSDKTTLEIPDSEFQILGVTVAHSDLTPHFSQHHFSIVPFAITLPIGVH